MVFGGGVVARVPYWVRWNSWGWNFNDWVYMSNPVLYGRGYSDGYGYNNKLLVTITASRTSGVPWPYSYQIKGFWPT